MLHLKGLYRWFSWVGPPCMSLSTHPCSTRCSFRDMCHTCLLKSRPPRAASASVLLRPGSAVDLQGFCQAAAPFLLMPLSLARTNTCTTYIYIYAHMIQMGHCPIGSLGWDLLREAYLDVVPYPSGACPQGKPKLSREGNKA